MSTDTVNLQPTILLAIDRPETFQHLQTQFARVGCHCQSVMKYGSLASALLAGDCSLVLLPMSYNGQTEERLNRVDRSLLGVTPVAYLSTAGSFEDAAAAARAGACDVLRLPLDPSSLAHVVEVARARHQELQRRNSLTVSNDDGKGIDTVGTDGKSTNGLSREVSPAFADEPDDQAPAIDADIARQLESTLVGASAEMDKIRRFIARVAPTEAALMISGPSGTGKELVASTIHRLSGRQNGPFVPVKMAAIPAGHADRELFGHVQDAFGDARPQCEGYCQSAHCGTLYLDEIGLMEMCVQPQLLRFAKHGTFQRVGSRTATKADARIISATDRDPWEFVSEGSLREDLYFQLHVLHLTIPPLCERWQDIEPLAEFFLQRAAIKNDKSVIGFSPSAMRVLQSYGWPGNVRQLENMIENLVILTHRRLIDGNEIPTEYYLSKRAYRNDHYKAVDGNGGGMDTTAVRFTPIQRHERAAIVDALQLTEGNVVHAAELLGLGQATVYRKIKIYRIPRTRKRTPRKQR